LFHWRYDEKLSSRGAQASVKADCLTGHKALPDSPKTDEARIIGKQALRSATFVAANYRAARRASSNAEFIAKIGTVVEETDETVFWLELLVETAVMRRDRMEGFLAEVNEFQAIFAASQRTARQAPLLSNESMI